MNKILVFFLNFFCLTFFHKGYSQTDEFVGPLSGWTNVKNYGAIGNGIADDTDAIETALKELGSSTNPSAVLYIPKGVYNISRQIVLKDKNGITVFGYHPDSVVIKWVGQTSKSMLLLDGISRAQFSRITWDGNSIAEAAYKHETNLQDSIGVANTATEHTDEIFKNFKFGIFSGGMYPIKFGQDSEFFIARCVFSNCTNAGISLADFNDLDWIIRDCKFYNCKTGITTDWGVDPNTDSSGGAGNFHIYNSIFLDSYDSDIKCGGANMFTIRNNYSKGSRRFLNVGRGVSSNTWLLKIQGNRIFNTTDPESIWMFNRGNVSLINNLIVSNDNQIIAPVRCFSNSAYNGGTDFVSIGNRFTVNATIALDPNSRFISIDNLVLNACSFDTLQPDLPSFNPNANRTIFEIPVGANRKQIQEIINAAHCLKGSKPVVYFRHGQYLIDSTLIIPPNADIQFIGDSFVDENSGSRLIWIGNTNELPNPVIVNPNVMMRIGKDSHAKFANLYFRGRYNYNSTNYGTILLIEESDGAGNRIYFNQIVNGGSESSGFRLQNLENTNIIVDAGHINEHKGSAFHVIGAGETTKNSVKIRGCFGGGSNPFFKIENSGKVYAGELWLENDSSFAYLSENSSLYASGGMVASNRLNNETLLTLDTSQNRMLLCQILFGVNANQIRVKSSSHAEMLMIGTLRRNDDNIGFSLINNSNYSNSGILNSRYLGSQTDGTIAYNNQGVESQGFIRNIYEPERNDNLEILKQLPSNKTDLRFYRVAISHGDVNVKVQKQLTLPEYVCSSNSTHLNKRDFDIPPTETADFKVFPNPVKDYLNIYNPIANESFAKIRIINSVGKIVYSANLLGNRGIIEVTKFASGFYYVIIESPIKLQTSKIFIVK
ncbi:MAG: glycosyl hydrolase family 28-related protein [Daejeonella sp.]